MKSRPGLCLFTLALLSCFPPGKASAEPAAPASLAMMGGDAESEPWSAWYETKFTDSKGVAHDLWCQKKDCKSTGVAALYKDLQCRFKGCPKLVPLYVFVGNGTTATYGQGKRTTFQTKVSAFMFDPATQKVVDPRGPTYTAALTQRSMAKNDVIAVLPPSSIAKDAPTAVKPKPTPTPQPRPKPKPRPTPTPQPKPKPDPIPDQGKMTPEENAKVQAFWDQFLPLEMALFNRISDAEFDAFKNEISAPMADWKAGKKESGVAFVAKWRATYQAMAKDYMENPGSARNTPRKADGAPWERFSEFEMAVLHDHLFRLDYRTRGDAGKPNDEEINSFCAAGKYPDRLCSQYEAMLDAANKRFFGPPPDPKAADIFVTNWRGFLKAEMADYLKNPSPTPSDQKTLIAASVARAQASIKGMTPIPAKMSQAAYLFGDPVEQQVVDYLLKGEDPAQMKADEDAIMAAFAKNPDDPLIKQWRQKALKKAAEELDPSNIPADQAEFLKKTGLSTDQVKAYVCGQPSVKAAVTKFKSPTLNQLASDADSGKLAVNAATNEQATALADFTPPAAVTQLCAGGEQPAPVTPPDSGAGSNLGPNKGAGVDNKDVPSVVADGDKKKDEFKLIDLDGKGKRDSAAFGMLTGGLFGMFAIAAAAGPAGIFAAALLGGIIGFLGYALEHPKKKKKDS